MMVLLRSVLNPQQGITIEHRSDARAVEVTVREGRGIEAKVTVDRVEWERMCAAFAAKDGAP
jgi:hypothetical protein